LLVHRIYILTDSSDLPDRDTYIDTENMLSSSSKAIIYKKLPRPHTQTLFVELVKYTPGETSPPESSSSSRPLSVVDDRASRHSVPPSPHHHQPQSPELNRHVPPPPPWSSRWSNAATAASPPTGAPPTSAPASPPLLPLPGRELREPPRVLPIPPISLKRKYDEDPVVDSRPLPPFHGDYDRRGLKRREDEGPVDADRSRSPTGYYNATSTKEYIDRKFTSNGVPGPSRDRERDIRDDGRDRTSPTLPPLVIRDAIRIPVKRKYEDAVPGHEDRSLPSPSSMQPSPKRRLTNNGVTLPPPSSSMSPIPPPRHPPTLSPSLAMIVSPISTEPRPSPRERRPSITSYSSVSAPSNQIRLPPMTPPSPQRLMYRN
jgi:hypothetical protein